MLISPAILFAILSMFLMGFVDFLYGRVARKEISIATVWCSQACVVFPATGIWAYLGGNYEWSLLSLFGGVTSTLFFIGFWAFLQSIRAGEIGVSTLIYRINFVMTALLAVVFLGEPITWRKGVGFALALLAIWMIAEVRLSARGGRGISRRSILWALVAMSAMGVLNIVFKIGVSKGLAPAMFIHANALFFTAFAYLYAWRVQGGPRFSRVGWRYGAVVGVCLPAAVIFLLEALKRGEASIVTPISQLSFVVSIVMAAIWMGERFSLRKFMGLLVALGTIAAFSIA